MSATSPSRRANVRVRVTHLDGSQSVETLSDQSLRDTASVVSALRKQGVLDILSVAF